MMDDLIKLCDDLENYRKRKAGVDDEIICVKSKLKCYIGEDYNKILKLKAEIKLHSKDTVFDGIEIMSFIISILALGLNIVGNVSDGVSKEYAVFVTFALSIIAIFCILFSHLGRKNGYRDKWIRYIEIVLEDIEKEYKNNK